MTTDQQHATELARAAINEANEQLACNHVDRAAVFAQLAIANAVLALVAQGGEG